MISAIASRDYWEVGNPIDYWDVIWPNTQNRNQPLEILCVGCGANQAAYYACLNKNWSVTGIDISVPSLVHAQTLKERHALNNLTLQQLDLFEIEHFDKQFDFIVCTGVLHHTHDPLAGLKLIKSCLKDNGIANLMVYGKTLRVGVYLLQEAFRSMGLKQTQDDVDFIKYVLESLPNDHAVRPYLQEANDLDFDAGVVDTFLNPVDQAYYVSEVFKLTKDAGLHFHSWCNPKDYSLAAHVPEELPIWHRLSKLDEKTAAHLCDLLTQKHGTHRWFAAKNNSKRSS